MKLQDRPFRKREKASRWAWVWPIFLLALVLTKTVGLVVGVVATSVYFMLKPKFGTGRAVAASCALGLLSGVAMVTMLADA